MCSFLHKIVNPSQYNIHIILLHLLTKLILNPQVKVCVYSENVDHFKMSIFLKGHFRVSLCYR